MTKEAAEIFEQYGGEIRENYSGRGMFGSTTTGVTFDSMSDYNSALADIILHNKIDEMNLILKSLGSFNIDSMGLGIIVY